MNRSEDVLVVDNEPAWQRFSKQALENAGLSVEVTGSLREAARRSSRKRFRLVLVDQRLVPTDQEAHLLDAIAKKANTVLISPQSSIGDLTRTLRIARRVDFKRKPYGVEGLVALVSEKLGR